MEVIPNISDKNIDLKEFVKKFSPSNDRYDTIRYIVGPELLEKIKNCRLFMIGIYLFFFFCFLIITFM